MIRVIFRSCMIFIFLGIYFFAFCRKDKKKEKHIQWWEDYYAQKENLLAVEEATAVEVEEENVWATAPQTALLRKEVLEKILSHFNLLSNTSFTFVNNQVVATIQKNKNILVFKMTKNSWILFIDYNLIVDEETTSKLLDFRTVINNNEKDFVSTIENLKIWFEEEHIFG